MSDTATSTQQLSGASSHLLGPIGALNGGILLAHALLRALHQDLEGPDDEEDDEVGEA